MSYEAFQSNVPEGAIGPWRVERFTVRAQSTEKAIDDLRAMFSAGGFGRTVDPGDYTRLMCGRSLWMSDTRDEYRDHIGLDARARGRVLLNGLGLGCAARMCLMKPDVERVTAVEIQPDVIDLVAPTLAAEFGERFEVIKGDAMTWKPPVGVRYGAVWHDIWEGICSDNLRQMGTLTRRYARRADWQGSWARGLCELARSRGN